MPANLKIEWDAMAVDNSIEVGQGFAAMLRLFVSGWLRARQIRFLREHAGAFDKATTNSIYSRRNFARQ